MLGTRAPAPAQCAEARLLRVALLKNENASRPRSGPSENSPAIYRWGFGSEIETVREADG